MKNSSEWRTYKEWSEDYDKITRAKSELHSKEFKVKTAIKKAIGDYIPEQTGEPEFIEDHNRVLIAQMLISLAKEYDPT